MALTEEQAKIKRKQLLRDGYCVVPGVLGGGLLSRLREFADSILDTRSHDPKFRYQGSDFHVNSERRWRSGRVELPKQALWSPIVDELIDLPEAADACRLLGFEGQTPDDTIILLSKPPFGPPLYWHQDLMEWNHPQAALPWPTRVFLSYYLVDTCRENGCLRAIPGTHLRRIPLHDQLPPAHGPEIQAADLSHPAFQAHPDEIDLPVKAGDLVINDARLLHAAHPNQTGERRTLVLQWHSIFPWPTVPTWWDGPLPDVLEDCDPAAVHEPTRIPGKYLAAQ
jgi:ectoine hydroxylase-related dioxygenase (phytanoyl-CoA dioxygenase family)